MLGICKRILSAEYNQLNYWYYFFFASGIIFSINAPPHILIISSSLVICILALFYSHLADKTYSIKFLLLCTMMFLIGQACIKTRIYSTQNYTLTKSQIAEITAHVERIKPNQYGNQLTLSQSYIPNLPQINKVRINVSNKINSQISVGDKISLRAKLFPLNSSILPEGYNFSFFLKMEKIQATGYAMSEVVIIDKASNYISYIQQMRRYIYTRLLEKLGPSTGNFAAAIIIGETKAIPLEVADAMRKTGTSHILSVSGLHLSLVALCFFVFSRSLLNVSNFLAYNTNIKILAACISIFGSFLYLQISGNNIAAIRAFIMTSILMIAIIFSRSPHPMRSVLIAGFCILLIMPEYILHPSFQLSFIAVMCLISGYEFYANYNFVFLKSSPYIGKLLLYLLANIYTSFLASVFTAPFVIFHFYQFANYAVIMNLIAVPLMSFIIMPLAILSLLLMPFKADGVSLYIIGYFIDIIIHSAEYISKLPHAIFTTGYISRISLMVFTIGFSWMCFWHGRLRYIGVIIMIYSLWLMHATKTPDIIIDKARDILAIKTQNEIILYSPYKLSSFTKIYWENWYAMPVQNIVKNIWKENDLLELKNGQTLSLNYRKCVKSDFMIVTSFKLKCTSIDNNVRLIDIDQLRNDNQIIIYFNDNN